MLLFVSCSITPCSIILRNSRPWEINCLLKNRYYQVLLSMFICIYIFLKFIYMCLKIGINSLKKLEVLIFVTIHLGSMIQILVTLNYFSDGSVKMEWIMYFLLNLPTFKWWDTAEYQHIYHLEWTTTKHNVSSVYYN